MKATNQPQDREREADVGLPPPKAGDRFRCADCGMELEVKTDCNCREGERVHVHCCGREMVQV